MHYAVPQVCSCTVNLGPLVKHPDNFQFREYCMHTHLEQQWQLINRGRTYSAQKYRCSYKYNQGSTWTTIKFKQMYYYQLFET